MEIFLNIAFISVIKNPTHLHTSYTHYTCVNLIQTTYIQVIYLAKIVCGVPLSCFLIGACVYVKMQSHIYTSTYIHLLK